MLLAFIGASPTRGNVSGYRTNALAAAMAAVSLGSWSCAWSTTLLLIRACIERILALSNSRFLGLSQELEVTTS
jgi:hypothetical protein